MTPPPLRGWGQSDQSRGRPQHMCTSQVSEWQAQAQVQGAQLHTPSGQQHSGRQLISRRCCACRRRLCFRSPAVQLSVLADLCRCNLLLGTCNLINFPLGIYILQLCDWILDSPTCTLQPYIWDRNSRLVARNLQLGAAFEISAVPTCKINTAAFETSWQADCFGRKNKIW